ncbi:MAG TPA: hypothetical protein VM286_02750 [Candidatus Thermoplasmatota archaeon]|nr:hypothetical protein [Candidatus Thermoplasmatota archaeon]
MAGSFREMPRLRSFSLGGLVAILGMTLLYMGGLLATERQWTSIGMAVVGLFILLLIGSYIIPVKEAL